MATLLALALACSIADAQLMGMQQLAGGGSLARAAGGDGEVEAAAVLYISFRQLWSKWKLACRKRYDSADESRFRIFSNNCRRAGVPGRGWAAGRTAHRCRTACVRPTGYWFMRRHLAELEHAAMRGCRSGAQPPRNRQHAAAWLPLPPLGAWRRLVLVAC